MFIKCDYSRTEEDDYKLNVEPKIQDQSTNYKKEASPVYDGVGNFIGWKIHPQYE